MIYGAPDDQLYLPDSYFKRVHHNVSDEAAGVRTPTKKNRVLKRQTRSHDAKGRRRVS